MEMGDYAVDNTYTGNSDLGEFLLDGVSSSGNGVQEMESTMKVLTTIDLDLACSSEKLVNLHVLLMHLLAWDNDLEAMAIDNSYMSVASTEKAFVFDLLSGILDSELREVDSFLDTLQAEIVDAHHKISSCRHLKELFTILEEKLHNSEESLKQSQEVVLEVKMQSAKLQRALSFLLHENWKSDEAMDLPENGQLSNINGKSKVQTAKQQRHILRMLEKSLARELELEKKISEQRQNEEQLKLKLHYTEQVALRMEEAAEVVWGRFLEAENAAEVLMGISRELVGRLQTVQFNLNASIQRESEVNSRLQDCIEQLNAKDIALQKQWSINAKHITDNSELLILREKVKLVEEQLKESELQLKNANSFNEVSQEQLCEMDNIIDSLKENICESENRAESAEGKVTQLTDTNLELNEELNFLKGNNDNNTQKVSLLEKQLRELEIQLQHAKASSEASQEQQNMLYSAIWDMETLIEDLKSKVSKAESRTESAEEQCFTLSETNSELNKELGFLRGRMECLETSLDQANNAKVASAKEINLRTELITDTVMQLALERERIHKQLYSLTKNNEILVEKLRNTKKDASVTVCKFNDRDGDTKEVLVSKDDSTNTARSETSKEAVSLSESCQVDEPSKDASVCETEEPPISANNATVTVSNLRAVRRVDTGHRNRIYVSMTILVALLSMSAVYLLNKKPVL